MTKTISRVCAAAALATIAGCNNPTVGTDAAVGPTDDTGILSSEDTGRRQLVDTGGHDTGMTMGGGSCAMPTDLDTAGMPLAAGTGRRIVSSNASAPVGPMAGLANGSCATSFAGDSSANHVVVFRYTVQTDSHLLVSTDDPGTGADMDTIVWLLTACTASGTELACDDDGGAGVTSRATTAAEVTAGTTVFVAVASYTDTTPGDFALVVQEIQPHATGEECSDTGLCVAGDSCLENDAGDMSFCVTDGTDAGQCRLAAPFCDAGLGCTEAMPEADFPGTCQTLIPLGDVCTSERFVCVPGATCIGDEGSTTMGRCLADGSEYGLCRLTGMACDSGFTCSEAMPTADAPGTCQVPIATGDVCTGRHFLCVAGSNCQPDEGSTSMGRCLADGSEFGNCRLTGTACDGALMCSVATPTAEEPGTCQAPIAGGGVCSERHSLCVGGFSCQLDDMSTTVSHCLADGVERGQCRLGSPYCDGSLTCSAMTPSADEPGNCLTPIGAGMPCSIWRYLCVDGSTCIADEGSETVGRCIVDGAAGGACRETEPQCDGRLTCDFFSGTCQP